MLEQGRAFGGKASCLPSCADRRALLALPIICVALAGAAVAQQEDSTAATPRLLEEVVTTASKKGVAEAAQDVVGAVSVLDGARLDALHVNDIEELGYSLPNVAFDGIGTGKGIANFSIRGMGVAGSIPSIDPTVGVFVDGMYLGVNYGVIMDMLDLEAVEVLRGPQGLLFGRNVIGGAVLLRSRRPSGESSGYASVRQASGPETRVAGAAEHSFMGGALDARLAISYRDDQGWFDNDAPGGGAVGAETAWSARPVLAFKPAENLDITVILERGNSDGDGPATQNRYRYQGFDFAIDEVGFSDVDWRHVVVEAERRFDNGRLVNVFGLRGVGHESLADIDSTTQPIFHLWAYTDQEQVSNELRYTGWLSDELELTVGAYAFDQKIRYRERRMIRAAWGQHFGGDQRHGTAGAFANVDLHPSERWVVSAGARYTVERKTVEIATAGRAACDARSHRCDYDFEGDDIWRNVTPRLAVQRWFGNHVQAYAEYTRGFRSGGYNLRSTSPTDSPGPFDEEEQDAVEIGLKTELARLRINLAAFRSEVRGLQRQVTREDVATGAIQVTANTADATIDGVEADATLALGDACTASAFVGIARGAYDRVRYDLDGDGSTVGDERLKLPRLAPLTFGVEGQCRRQMGPLGVMTARISLSHRGDSEISHDNTGVLDGGDVLDLSISSAPTPSLRFTAFGRNLLGEVFRRSHFDLTGLVDSTYSPLKEGRIVGIEARWAFR